MHQFIGLVASKCSNEFHVDVSAHRHVPRLHDYGKLLSVPKLIWNTSEGKWSVQSAVA